MGSALVTIYPFSLASARREDGDGRLILGIRYEKLDIRARPLSREEVRASVPSEPRRASPARRAVIGMKKKKGGRREGI